MSRKAPREPAIDGNDDGLFDSPQSGTTTPKTIPPTARSLPIRSTGTGGATFPGPEDGIDREKRLRAELATLRQMNESVELLNDTFATAKGNLTTMQNNMNSAKTLLHTWTRILNQAEHNQRLILNPQWPGATQDLQDIEHEDLRRNEEAERKMQKETRRREEAERKREEAARSREESERNRGRGLGRTRSTRGAGVGSSSRGAVSVGRGKAAPTRGSTSGIARGVPVRGRGRG